MPSPFAIDLKNYDPKKRGERSLPVPPGAGAPRPREATQTSGGGGIPGFAQDIANQVGEQGRRLSGSFKEGGVLGISGQLGKEIASGYSGLAGINRRAGGAVARGVAPTLIGQARADELLPAPSDASVATPATPATLVAPAAPAAPAIEELPIPGGGVAYKNTAPAQEYGQAIYSDTRRGATEVGFEEDLAAGGGRQVVQDPGRPGSPGITISGDASNALTGLVTPGSQAAPAARPLPAPQAAAAPVPAGGGGPDYGGAQPLSAHARGIREREMRLALGDLQDEMKSGRISAKKGKVMMKGLTQLHAARLGMDPADAAKLFSQDYATQQRTAASAGRDASALQQEGVRQAGRLEQEKLRKLDNSLPAPPEYRVVKDTDPETGQERSRVFDQTSGTYKGDGSGRRIPGMFYDGMEFLGGDPNKEENYRKPE